MRLSGGSGGEGGTWSCYTSHSSHTQERRVGHQGESEGLGESWDPQGEAVGESGDLFSRETLVNTCYHHRDSLPAAAAS